MNVSPPKSRSLSQRRRGQSLVEFALVALVLYLLLAGMLTFGRALFVAQSLQSAADIAAREIALTPMPALDTDNTAFTFEDALATDAVRTAIFDDAFLVIDLDAFFAATPNGSVFEDLVPTLPLLNQQLVPSMIVDRPDFDGDGVADARLLRYPGALLSRTAVTPPAGVTYPAFVVTEQTVGIPLVTGRDATGTETVRWVGVVEEIESVTNPDPFSIESTQRGVVALRINYPFQSAVMSSFRPNPAGPFEPNVGNVNVANDGGVVQANPGDRPGDPIAQPLVGPEVVSGTYGGQFGLGAQAALGQTVRPYRRVISTQAIFRREVFQ